MTRERTLILVMTLAAAVAAREMGHGLWIHAKARLAQALLHRAWERTVAGETRVKPWPWADTWPVARLRVPALDVDLIVLEGVSGRTLAFGPGRAPAGASPGEAGTAFVTGHRDTHFRFLERVRVGDVILVQAPGRAGGRYVVREVAHVVREDAYVVREDAYVVREITVVDARRAVVRSDARGDHLVLLTCYPFDAITPGGPLRYVVAADRAAG